jgi:hypothetical protein
MDDPSSKPMVDYSTLLSPSHMVRLGTFGIRRRMDGLIN